MNITFIIADMCGGGSERVISTLANYYIKDHFVTIITTSGNNLDYILDERIALVRLGSKTDGSFAKRILRIRKLHYYMTRHKEDLFISFGTETNLYSIIAAIGVTKNLVLSERSNPEECNYKILRNVIYRFGYHFAFQTDMAMYCFPKWMLNKGFIVPNPLPNNLLLPCRDLSSNKIVAVGRLEPMKGHFFLLKVFSSFVKKFPDYKLIIYGKGSLQSELENYANANCPANSVIFAGFCENVLEQIKDAAIYILPSEYEGISNALLEAMALGLPIIATNCPIGGCATLIDNNKNGILISVNDEIGLSKAMEYFINNPSKAKGMGKEALKVREIYSVENVGKIWLSFYQK